MCGEIANMVWAQSLMNEGKIDSNSQVRWAVFGVTDTATGETDWMGPCGNKHGKNGCSTYVASLASQSGGGGTCIRKREPAVILKPVVKPKPNAPDSPTSPGSLNSPDSPDSPDAPERLVPGEKNPNDPANPNGDTDDVLKPATDKDAETNKDFEEGAICKLPVRKTPNTGGDIPDPSALANFVPPPDNNPPVLRIRGVGWN
jgi:hypothetical protein